MRWFTNVVRRRKEREEEGEIFAAYFLPIGEDAAKICFSIDAHHACSTCTAPPTPRLARN